MSDLKCEMRERWSGRRSPNPKGWNRRPAEWRRTPSSQKTELREITRNSKRPKYNYKTSRFRETKNEELVKVKRRIKQRTKYLFLVNVKNLLSILHI